ncbi:MAG: hypothetical protein F4Y15_07995, partial [Acidimicrobiales bacterium]|nr:hypothetical protein [Acidimicrobiales bacterium]
MRASAERPLPADNVRDTARDGPREHLRRLLAWWSLLADLSFSDLLLFVPGQVTALDELPDEVADTDSTRPDG